MSTDLVHDAKVGAIGVVIGITLASGVCAYMAVSRPPAVAGSSAPEVIGASTTTLQCEDVVVYGHKVTKKLSPSASPSQHATAAVVVPAGDKPHTVSSIYDYESGKTTIVTRTDPRPWMATDRRTMIGAFLVARDESSEPVGELLVTHDFAQIKALHIGAVGHIDTDGRRAIGGGVWMAW